MNVTSYMQCAGCHDPIPLLIPYSRELVMNVLVRMQCINAHE